MVVILNAEVAHQKITVAAVPFGPLWKTFLHATKATAEREELRKGLEESTLNFTLNRFLIKLN